MSINTLGRVHFSIYCLNHKYGYKSWSNNRYAMDNIIRK